MSRAKTIKRAGLIAGYSRFGLLPDEIKLLDRAALLEERTRGDFCRIAALQRAKLVLTLFDHTDLECLVSELKKEIQSSKPENNSLELPFKEE